jgi:filamentous hemagglutinin
MEGKGNTDETLRQSQLLAKGNLVIKAVDGLHIDVKQINQNTVSQTIDAMVKADPQLAWLKDAEKRGDVDWRQIKEVHESFKYSHSGLGAGAMLAIIIIVTVLTAGAASTAVASASTAMGASAGGTMAAASAATAATATTAATAATAAGLGNVIATSVLTSMASTAAVSAINNKGNLGAALKETFSSDSMKQALIAGASAGFINYASGNWFGAQTDAFTNKVTGPSIVPHLSDPAALARFGTIQLAGGAVRGALSEALGQGHFKDAMTGSLFNILQAAAFTGAGDLGAKLNLEESGLSKTAIHAVVGGLVSEAMGADFKTGAIAAGANEALISTLDKSDLLSGKDSIEHDRLVNAASKLVGLVAAASVGGDVAVGSEIAGSAQSYNRKLHVLEKERLAKEAANLDSTVGKSKTGISWSILLDFAAGGQIDEEDNRQLQAILGSYGKNNPEGVRVSADLTLAGDVVKQLQSEKVLLTFADGTPIVANGEKVYAFTSTDSQYKDSQLFSSKSNTTLNNSPDGLGIVPDKWIDQYGEAVATKRLREIGAINSDAELSADQWRMFREYATGGLNANIDLKLLAEMMPPGRIAKGSLLAVLKELVTRDALANAEKSIAGEAIASGKMAPLPEGYREGIDAGSKFAETANLPDGYRRVINTKTGSTEVLGPNGSLYAEPLTGGLVPKGGGFAQHAANEAASKVVGNVTAPIDFDGHIFSGEVKANGSVVGAHSTATGDVRVIPGTESLPNPQGVYSAKIEVKDPINPGGYLLKTNNNGESTMFPKDWSTDRIKVEVDEAFKNKVVQGNRWTGVTPSGVGVTGYLSPKTTVYPLMEIK